jgi:hypothetical protein
MTLPTFILCASLVVPKLQLIVCALLVGPVLVAYFSNRISAALHPPIILFAGVMPLLLLGLTWTEFRFLIFGCLVALLPLAYFSKRFRRALHFLTILLAGVIPWFLLVAVEDISWSAGFLLAYLGVQSCHAKDVGERHRNEGDELLPHLATESARYFVLGASLAFLWVLMLAALLWYLPDPETTTSVLGMLPNLG